MKFEEELASQMVQEWKAAYMDYTSLKKVLENLMIFRQQTALASDQSYYQTMFLRSIEEDAAFELEFFMKLDDEFNKVVDFYKAKVEEVKIQEEELCKAIITLKNGVEDGVQLDLTQEVELSSEGSKNTKNSIFLRNLIENLKSDISFSKEEELRQAFIKLYRQLQDLRSYSLLNILAFSKIMKKYDKITSRNASHAYLEKIETSHLANSDEVHKLMERLEATFVKNFADGNHMNGKKSLNYREKNREKHRTTFFLGLFTGCSIALIMAIVVSMHGRGLLHHPGRDRYMETIFPLYSLFGFIVLHLLMNGSNAFLWRRFQVNYPSIFGFRSDTELGFRQIFLIASGLSVLSLAAVVSNLDMEMDPSTLKYSTLTELLPLALLILVLALTFCPFKIVYHSSRFYFIRCSWHCLSAPLHKGTFTDFFLADQLTSQVQAFRSLLFYVFYYFWGDFTTRSNAFLTRKSYKIMYIVVAIIPSWIRLLQCLRRVIEEKDKRQGLNALKYLSTIVAIAMRTMHDLKKENFWKIMAATTSGVTTIYSTYWDVVFDWGLLCRSSRNPWLRDELLISNKAVYFAAIVANILLRLVWMQSVLDFNETEFLHRRAIVALVGCLEIVRRGIWNFFRLENEHFHQIAKHSAVKTKK